MNRLWGKYQVESFTVMHSEDDIRQVRAPGRFYPSFVAYDLDWELTYVDGPSFNTESAARACGWEYVQKYTG